MLSRGQSKFLAYGRSNQEADTRQPVQRVAFLNSKAGQEIGQPEADSSTRFIMYCYCKCWCGSLARQKIMGET